MKDQRKCMVHFEDKGMFPKVHWRILEDSGRLGLINGARPLGMYCTYVTGIYEISNPIDLSWCKSKSVSIVFVHDTLSIHMNEVYQ